MPDLTQAEITEYLIRFSLESICLIGIMYFLYSRLNLKASLNHFPLLNRIGIYTLLLGCLLVQVIDRFQYHYPQHLGYFPFVRFAMYQTAHASSYKLTYAFSGEDQNGERFDINPTKLLSPIGLPAVSSRFIHLAEAISTGKDGKEFNKAQKDLELFAIAFKKILAPSHPMLARIIFSVSDISNYPEIKLLKEVDLLKQNVQ